MKKLILASMLSSMALVGANSFAQVTSNFQANSSVVSKCVMSAENIAFGNLDIFSTQEVKVNGSISVLCSNNVSYAVTPDAGYENGRVHIMKNSNNNDAITLIIDKTTGGIWARNAANPFNAVGNGQNQTHGITAIYQRGQLVYAYDGSFSNQYNYQASPGSYSTTVGVTVTY